MPSVYFQTFGCQMNGADSDAVRKLLFERGFTESASPSDSGLIVVNTCSVREAAEKRAMARITEFASGKKTRPKQKLWVIGCMAERLGETLKERVGGIDLIIGAKEMERIEEVIEDVIEKQFPIKQVDYNAGYNAGYNAKDIDIAIPSENGPEGARPYNTLPFNNMEGTRPLARPALTNDLCGQNVKIKVKKRETGSFEDNGNSTSEPIPAKTPVTDFVTILRGCDNYCAYCVVPYVRGGEQSIPYNNIETQVLEKVGAGVREITFLGQNVNSYNYNGIDFPQFLLKMSEIGGLERIRFTTSHPKDCTEQLIDVMASSGKFAAHIHLPVQAGADRVLSIMNRKYTSSRYLYLIDMIRKRIPRADITSDILVGFPTETDSEFRETLSLVREARFTTAFMFAYSPREGTAAADMEETISKQEKLARLSELIDLQTEITREIYEKTVGQEIEVLVTERQTKRDKAWMGQDNGCKRVLISCENAVAGMIFKVRAVRSSGMTLVGQLV